MKLESLFGLALGITSPWSVKAAEFSVEEGRLDLHLDFKRGAHFFIHHAGQRDQNRTISTRTHGGTSTSSSMKRIYTHDCRGCSALRKAEQSG